MDNYIVAETAVESKSLSEQVRLTQSQVAERAMESADTGAASSTNFVVSTYDDAFEQWLLEWDKSRRTIRLYLIGLQSFREWFERKYDEALDPARITRLDVRWYKEHLVQTCRYAASTVNAYLAAVRAFCRWALETNLTNGDPSSTVKGVKIAASEAVPRWLDKNERERLLKEALNQVDAARGKKDYDAANPRPGYVHALRDYAIVVTFLNTGLRLSELANVHVADVIINPRSGDLVVRYGKGGKTRTVELNKDARNALTEWLKVRPEISGVKNLFTSQKVGPMTARAIARRIERIGIRANVKVTPHMLRHTFAKTLIDAGDQIDTVASFLGHESVDTTKRYTTASKADRRRSVERISIEEEEDDSPIHSPARRSNNAQGRRGRR